MIENKCNKNGLSLELTGKIKVQQLMEFYFKFF